MAILELIVTTVFESFVRKLSENNQYKLLSKQSKQAFGAALGLAIERYSRQGQRLIFVEPLLSENSPLTSQSVAREIARVIEFDQEPDFRLIGDRWKSSLEAQPPTWVDFESEAQILVEYLISELKATDAFREVFVLKSLEAMNMDVSISVQHLATIEEKLDSLINLMSSGFGIMLRNLETADPNIREQIRDFSQFINEKSSGFVGRKKIIDDISKFVQESPRGYFVLRGDPGIGKSAIMAEIVKRHGYIHHFNIRSEGINTVNHFMRSLCSQLISVYDLPYSKLPSDARNDSSFLNSLLGHVSSTLREEKCVIVVDALDEVVKSSTAVGGNTLLIPKLLPNGIFFILSSRKGDDVRLTFEIPEQRRYTIEHDEKNNLEDIREYITNSIKRDEIQRYLKQQDANEKKFIDELVARSQGNFMYIRMVLPEIAKGIYSSFGLSHIPLGLEGYYEDSWQRMKEQNELDWFDHKLPIIIALTKTEEPVSIDLICKFSKIDPLRAKATVNELSQFLHQVDVEYEGGRQRRYRWYHASFFEFIEEKSGIKDEKVNLQGGQNTIGATMLEDFGLDDSV